MSYVNLHAQFPMGATEYEACSARNAELQQSYEVALAAWDAKNAVYQQYLKDLKIWQDNEQRRRAKAAGLASSYASKLASYKAALRTYNEKFAAYQAVVDYNAGLDAADFAQKQRAMKKYGITSMGGANCVDPSQKPDIQRACEFSQVKGIGGPYLFDLTRTNPCLLNEFNVCKPRKVATHPGNPPTAPTPPPATPDPEPQPKPVADPGSKPTPPGYEQCRELSAGGIATFGLLAVLIVGGGAFGYHQWKKRKKAA